jgi:glycosyltransferase involved in cell wall biosynthesis
MAEQQDAFEPVFYRYRPYRVWSVWSKKIHAQGIKRHLGYLDPMWIAGQQIGRWWNRQGKHISPDAIHTVTHVPGFPFVSRGIEIPLSVTVDCTRRLVASDFGTTCFSPADIAREQQVFDRVSGVASLTHWAAESVRMDYRVPAERIVVVGAPAQLPQLKKSSEGRNAGLPRIGFVGGDFRRKGGPELVRWHQEFFQQQAELHIVSRGAPELDLPNVFVHGSMPHQQVMEKFFPSLDLFCLPTKQEMAGFVFAEAAAAGVPAITYASGGTAEFVRHDRTGYVVPQGDENAYVAAIRSLLEDANRRETFSLQARKLAEQEYEQHGHFQRLFDFIIDGIQNPRPAPVSSSK